MSLRLLALLTASLAAPAFAAPTEVFIGTHVVEMRNVDARAQSFHADFYTFVLDHKGKGELALKIDKWSRVLFPLLVVGIFAFFITRARMA